VFYFLHELKDFSIVFNIFRYITFRSAAASITAFLICLWAGPPIIRWLKSFNVTQNQKREYAEKIHSLYAHKEKVPTMGGVLIVLSVVVASLLWGNLTNRFVWILVLTTVGFGLVGFLDDWIKLRSKSSRGLT
jgi:phospho-N-acetylmuramoyl-pentapeptide-transferase